MYWPPPMNDPSSRTTAQSTPNRAAVLSPLKYRRLTCAPLRPDQDAARPARPPAGERAGPPGRSRPRVFKRRPVPGTATRSARPADDRQHLLARDDLDPIPAVRRTECLLVGVEQHPARPLNGRNAPLGEERNDGARIALRGALKLGGVGHQVTDGLGRVGLGVPDQTDRAT